MASAIDQLEHDENAELDEHYDGEEGDYADHDADAEPGDGEGEGSDVPAADDAAARKKKLFNYGLYGASGLVIAAILGMVVKTNMGHSAPQPVAAVTPVAEAVQAAYPAQDTPAPVVAAQAPQADLQATNPQAAPAGAQAPQLAGAQVALQPVAQPMPAPLAVAPVPSVGPVAAPVGPQAAPVASPAPVVAAAPVNKTKDAPTATAEDSGKVAELTAQVSELRAQLVAMQSKLADAQKPKAAPVKKEVKPVLEAKADDVAPAAEKPAAKPVVKPVAKAETKATKSVRADYRVYAMRDGRLWLQGKNSSEIYNVLEGDELPDGTRVRVIDEAHGEVITSAGVIR